MVGGGGDRGWCEEMYEQLRKWRRRVVAVGHACWVFFHFVDFLLCFEACCCHVAALDDAIVLIILFTRPNYGN